MSKITRLQVKNFLGVEELGLAPGKINVFKGPMGSGKSSVIEAIEKGFTNNNRRTEVVKHGAEEATLFIELDSGLQIERRIRTEKSDYLKVRKDNEYVPSTEKFLRSLVRGEVFRPVEWVYKDIKEQTKSILNMIDIPWTEENIEDWFGELTYNIDYSRHILQVLKAIEMKYYNDREEINREIRELKTRISLITKELPPGYDGEVYRNLRVQDYYNKVKEGGEVNCWIAEAKAAAENLEVKISSIEDYAENEKNKLRLAYNEQRSDLKDIIENSRAKIEKTRILLAGLDSSLQGKIKEIESENQRAKWSLEVELQDKIAQLKAEYEAKGKLLDTKTEEDKEKLRKECSMTREQNLDLININEMKISSKESELLSIDKIEAAAMEGVEKRKAHEAEAEQYKALQALEYLSNNEPVDIGKLQRAADEVAEMQSYLRQWDTLLNIRDEKLAEKEKYSAWLTVNIERARSLPVELLKLARMPVEGISVDEKGLIRINGTLIDGLSDGEKLELAMKIARVQAGELKVICIDKWESLNEKAREKLLEEMEKDDFQYFVTQVEDTENDEVEIERR